MEFSFRHTIASWKSWGSIFQSAEAFRDLITIIFDRAGIQLQSPPENLTPGTNAVFKVGNFVVKIFAPVESGLNMERDFERELLATQHAASRGLHTPNVVAEGCIQDRYLFRYIITDFIEGKEAGDVLPTYGEKEKARFVWALRRDLKKLNVVPNTVSFEDDIKTKALQNERWNVFSEQFRMEFQEAVEEMSLTKSVFVHGDLTGENILILKNGELIIIDYADCVFAPPEYEYPPIVFSLFKADRALVREFIGDIPCEVFIEKLFSAILLHDFGSNMVQTFYPEWTGKSIGELRSPSEIKHLLIKNLL